MTEDSTFNLCFSTNWTVDWENPRIEERYEKASDSFYTRLTFTVTKDMRHDWKSDLGEGVWYKHSNEETILKHASFGITLICFCVHYESYVKKGSRKRRTDEIPFRSEDKGYTSHFRRNIAFFMSGYGMTLSRCAAICHTTPAIVKEVNKARLFRLAGDMKPRHYSEYLCVDEFLIEHGHRYCTIVIDAVTGELLYLEKGKKKEQLKHFFRWVGDDFMRHVKAISMDMNTNYSAAVNEAYPDIEINYDLFHIVQWYNKQVIDSLRRSEAKRLRNEAQKLTAEGLNEEAAAMEAERRLLFSSRFLLLSNEKTLKAKDKLNRDLNRQAKEAAKKDGRNPDEVGKRKEDNSKSRKLLLDTNHNLQNAVKAREELSDILRIPSSELMREKLEEWISKYSAVGVAQLTKFTSTIRNRMEGIVSKANSHISSGRIEGVNGFVKNLRRSAFGYQDFDYFALLIWEQTHRKKRYKGTSGSCKQYHRKSKTNIKRLKQTVFLLDKEAS